MDSQDQPSLLRLPEPDRSVLSFCAASGAGLSTWLAALPKANLGETARLLYQAILEINQLHASASLRLQLLELMRPEIAYVCKQLERFFFNQPLVLGERPRQVAGLCQALQKSLALGYKQAAVALGEKPDRDNLQPLSIALQRAIHCLCALQIRASQLYNPSPAGLWLELHQLFALAVEHGVQEQRVSDPVALHARQTSAQASYLVALLLGCARCNQMRQRSIGQLAELLEAWGALVRLQPAGAEGGLLAFSPRVDEPPRYRSLFDQAELAQLLGIDPSRLVGEAAAHLAAQDAAGSAALLPLPKGLSLDLLQHLTATWSDISERTFNRAPAQGTLRLCIGMSALHYYLSGRRLFSELLQHPEPKKNEIFRTGGNVADIWAQAYDAAPTGGDLFVDERIDFIPPSPEPSQADEAPESFPTFTVQLVNHSPGGYCLAWPREVPDQLQAGELVGLQDRNGQEWRIAVVRWLRQVRGAGLQMGIELIAPEAQPCGLKLVRGTEQASAYLRALLLPEIAALAKPATVIAPRLPFQEGHKVLINQNGDEHRAVLGSRQSSTGSYNQFEYQIAGRQAPPGGTAARSGPAADDFEGLWPSL